MLKKTFWGKRKVWKAFGAALVRQHKPAHSTGEDVSACDIASYPAQPRPGPALTHSYPPPTNLTSIASGSKASLFQLLTNPISCWPQGHQRSELPRVESQSTCSQVYKSKVSDDISAVRGYISRIVHFLNKTERVQPTLLSVRRTRRTFKRDSFFFFLLLDVRSLSALVVFSCHRFVVGFNGNIWPWQVNWLGKNERLCWQGAESRKKRDGNKQREILPSFLQVNNFSTQDHMFCYRFGPFIIIWLGCGQQSFSFAWKCGLT